MEEPAINSRKILEKVSAKIYFYEFNLTNELEKEGYKNLCLNLKEKGCRKFHVISEYSSWSAFQKTVNELNGNVEITDPKTFEGQFISNVGRIHDWNERYIPNKNLKIGYYIIH